MESDGTTAPVGRPDETGTPSQHPHREDSYQRTRPLWQEPLRGALYAVGGSAITLLTAWFQHWMW
ncbi:hypothetical protein HEK616_30830 [Streptomyces nigrescens]|uniref:Integral membrane protein n=1 Tax=Streptomyces nigrescens TaxID=1920 RepID=A0ABM7ZTC4_STRNI|nr:hypothetical protein [Streptomyces nigrescens]BDM69596.1 hypothetical protein HEK616_30830 [Streptomyces nigrescens]